MFYLYKKTHPKTGLKYLGQTQQDPYSYRGSGVYWKNHLKKYGGQNIITEIVGIYSEFEELQNQGIYYSKLWNIVESKEWANLTIEDGTGGAAYLSEKSRQKMREKRKGRKPNLNKKRSSEVIEKHRIFMLNNNPFKGKKHSEETKNKLRATHLGKSFLSKEGSKKLSMLLKDNNPNKRGRELHSCYGKKWYNNGIKEFKAFPQNKQENWLEGRIK